MQHEKVVGSVADGQGLRDGDVVFRRDGGEEGAFAGRVDDGVRVDEFAGEGLGCGVNFEL